MFHSELKTKSQFFAFCTSQGTSKKFEVMIHP
jgi:hypothetical protein